MLAFPLQQQQQLKAACIGCGSLGVCLWPWKLCGPLTATQDSTQASTEQQQGQVQQFSGGNRMHACHALHVRRCADTQDEKGRWNNFHDDIDHDGHAIDW